ncbi:L-threonylcarbamoyladenylate synthase [Thomasclavelia sp.]|uniref:L-threonylcarbamoyladenylate synthase n=1 Tax=Thomasclavelia sp. TaxID=3025757 RepID=UPI0025D61E4C|nr:L-threonylcarbamoyladenylate synthase [Thomasclavelia sp.]
MNTVLVEKDALDLVAKLVSDNKVVAFPTETVFGLGVKFGSKEALDALYQLKQRDKGKAISMMIASAKDIEKYAYINEPAKKIINAFMPGMITIILKKRPFIDDYFTASLDTIGIRIPDDDFVLSLLEKTGPMLVTSANMSGKDSLVNDQSVSQVFDGKIPLIVKGESISKKASTIVDLSKGKVEILRLGDISEDEIAEVLK